jgi:hypothetical protein
MDFTTKNTILLILNQKSLLAYNKNKNKGEKKYLKHF